MRNVVLFIAMSLDGFIAAPDGGVDWLTGQDSAAETADSYGAFVPTIDTVLMGWNTYHQVVTELSPGQWPYEGLDCYVFTHRQASPVPGVRFVSCDPCALVDRLKARPGRDIWICGGAQLIRQLSDRIDRLQISVIPTLLGQGVRLFSARAREQKLRLTGVTHSNGIVELTYQPR